MNTKELKAEIEANKPRPYNLDAQAEMRRLYGETSSYLKTCHAKHGTDWEGRRFAIEALDKLWASLS